MLQLALVSFVLSRIGRARDDGSLFLILSTSSSFSQQFVNYVAVASAPEDHGSHVKVPLAVFFFSFSFFFLTKAAKAWLAAHSDSARRRPRIVPSYSSSGHLMFDSLGLPGGFREWVAFEAADSHLLVVVTLGGAMNGPCACMLVAEQGGN